MVFLPLASLAWHIKGIARDLMAHDGGPAQRS